MLVGVSAMLAGMSAVVACGSPVTTTNTEDQARLETPECNTDSDCVSGLPSCVTGRCEGTAGAEAAQGGAPSNGLREAVPDGCGFLAERNASPLCTSGTRCDQVRVEERARTYALVPVASFVTSEGARVGVGEVAACLEGWLRALGSESVQRVNDEVHVTGAWGALSPGIESAVVDRYRLDCVSGACDYCRELDEAGCRADSFCVPHEGSPIDDSGSCRQPSVFAGCNAGDLVCSAAEAVTQAPDGQCWHFAHACDVPGFVASSTCAQGGVGLPACSATQ